MSLDSKIIRQILFPVIVGVITILVVKKFSSLYYGWPPESFFTENTFLFYSSFISDIKISLIVSFQLALIIIFKWKNLSVDIPGPIRIILIIGVTLLIWALCLSSYNYYFNKWFLLDRLFLLLIGILSCINPLFIIIFLIDAIVFIGQFKSIDGMYYTLTDKKIVLDVLCVIWCFSVFYVTRLWKNWFICVIVILALIGAWYVQAGAGKYLMDWYAINSLSDLYLSSLVFDWLPNLGYEWKNRIYNFLQRNNSLILYSTFFIELIAPLLLIVSRKTSIFALFSFVIFHLIVFITSGIFFWKWVALEIGLIAVFLFYYNRYVDTLIDLKYYGIYLCILFCSIIVYRPTSLAWIDSNYVHSYKILLKDMDGNIYNVPSSYFAPYDVAIAQNRFFYIDDIPILTKTYGSHVDVEFQMLMDKVKNGDLSPEAARQYEIKNGRVMYDVVQKESLMTFLSTFLQNKLEQKDFPNIVPEHIYQDYRKVTLPDRHMVDSLVVKHTITAILAPDLENELYSSSVSVKLLSK